MSEKVGKISDHCAQVSMQMVDPSERGYKAWRTSLNISLSITVGEKS